MYEIRAERSTNLPTRLPSVIRLIRQQRPAVSNKSAVMADFRTEFRNQSWRFTVPIFLHVGVVHLIINMLAQITAAAQIEREMGERRLPILAFFRRVLPLTPPGTLPFLLVYFAGGIYGFILGGNFSRVGVPSVGASGALFAVVSFMPVLNICAHGRMPATWSICVYTGGMKPDQNSKQVAGLTTLSSYDQAVLLAIEFAIGIAIGYM